MRTTAEFIVMPIIKKKPFFGPEDYKMGPDQCDPGWSVNLFYAFYILTDTPCLSNLLYHNLGDGGGCIQENVGVRFIPLASFLKPSVLHVLTDVCRAYFGCP